MTQASIAPNVHQTPDVHLYLTPQVALDLVPTVNGLAQRCNLRLGQVPDFRTGMYSSLTQNFLAQAAPEARFQFERLGYFCVDPDSKPTNFIFNRTVTLKDPWAKIKQGNKK